MAGSGANRCMFASRVVLHFLAIGELTDHYPCLVQMQFSAVLENYLSGSIPSCLIRCDAVTSFLSMFNMLCHKFFGSKRRTRFHDNFLWFDNPCPILIDKGPSPIAINLELPNKG